MSNTPTPETDTEKFGSLCGNDWNGWRLRDVVPAAISRRLERERDALNAKCEQIGRQLVVAERELAEARAEVARLRGALQRLADCDFVITPHDRMDAVRTIARAKNAETK